MNFTFNDILLTAISKTMNDYLKERTEDKKREKIVMTCPFSLRPPPQTLTDFTFGNDFAIVPLSLRLVDSLTNGIK